MIQIPKSCIRQNKQNPFHPLTQTVAIRGRDNFVEISIIIWSCAFIQYKYQ